MDAVERLINQAVKDGSILGAVLLAKDKSGCLDYCQTFGNRRVNPDERPMTQDTVFAIASMTKLMTTIAALQLVERKAIDLDDDVTPILPVLAKQHVLRSFSPDGVPITEKRKLPITLRQLLTHSSGVGYDFLQAEIKQYKKFHKLDRGTTINERFGLPLLYQPGEGWSYGGSLDWVGQLVEKLSGLTLESYMNQQIWSPLGLKDMTFWPQSKPKEYSERHAAMTIRDTKTGKAVQSRKPIDLGTGLIEAAGGQGALATMPEFMEIVHSLLLDDGRLLKQDTTDIMFQPQLSSAAKTALLAAFKHPEWAVGDFPNTGEYDWGLGGILIDGNKHPYHRKGAILWSGAPNLVWFIDRKAGLCGVFGVQVLPSADPKTKALIKAFGEGVYKQCSIKTKL